MFVILAFWEAKAGGSLKARKSTPPWATERDPVSIFKIRLKLAKDRTWWHMPVILAPWEAEVGTSPQVRSSRPVWPTWRNLVSTKNTKISQAWWHTPVIPATQETETEELLELRRRRLQ